MTAPKRTSSTEELKAALLGHGLDLNGTIGSGLIWEPPVKIFHSSHVTDVEIGAYSYISPKAEIRHAVIGRYCSVGDNVNMRGSAHPKEWLSSHPFPYSNIFTHSRTYRPPLTFEGYGKRTLIGHDVWIGSQAIILPGVRIGTGAIVGAGAVVAKDVPAYAVAVGNPARIVKYRFEQPLIDRLLQSEWWPTTCRNTLSANRASLSIIRKECSTFWPETAGRSIGLAPAGRAIHGSRTALSSATFPPLGPELGQGRCRTKA